MRAEAPWSWPPHPVELAALQRKLATMRPPPWVEEDEPAVGGCFVCFFRGGGMPGSAGEPGWAAAVVWAGGRVTARSVVMGDAGAPYRPGLLASREGPLLEAAVRSLSVPPPLLLVNATGRDHPRRAGLALHLGWVLGLPTVGVTHRPLVAGGDPPGQESGARSPLHLDGETVGWWLRTRAGARPVAVSPGWRTDLESAARVVMAAVRRARTPEPIRQARRLARLERAGHI